MPDKMGYVLLGDGDPKELLEIQGQLEHHHLQVMAVDNGADVLEALRADPQPDAVILDRRLAEAKSGDGVLLDTISRNKRDSIPLFLLTEDGAASEGLSLRVRAGVRILNRPFNSTQFLMVASNAGLKHTTDTFSPVKVTNPPSEVRTESHNLDTIPSRMKLPASSTTASSSPEMGWELRRYWHLLLRHKWTLVMVTAAAIAVSVGVSKMLTPIYQATSTIRVASAAGGQFDYGASVLATRLSNTYVEIAKSAPILDELITRLGIDKPPKIEVELVPETELLQISARHTDPQIAQNAANILSDIMVERSLTLYAGDVPTARELLETQLAQTKADLDQAVAEYSAMLLQLNADGNGENLTEEDLAVLARQVTLRQDLYADLVVRYEDVRSSEEMRSNAITIVEYAALPTSPASPKMMLNAILGACAGLVSGLLLVIVLESFSNSVSGSTEVMTLTGLPVLAQIPIARRTRGRRPDLRRGAALEDAFQSLQVRLQLSSVLQGVENPVILVTSPEPGTGKTTVAVNLALSMARAGNRVILVDADLHQPAVHRALNLEQPVGLVDILAGDQQPEAALKATSESNLRVLTSGLTGKDMTFTGLISSYKIKLVFRALAEKCDYLIVDSPAVLVTGYSVALAKHANATILVTAQNYTDRDSLDLSLKQLSETRALVIGVVVNKAEFSRPYAHRYNRYTRR